jgi:hypothetical protein
MTLTDGQKQALQRFIAALIAEVIALVIAVLQSPDLAAIVTAFAGEGSLLTTLILALVGPLILALGKLRSGPTQKTLESIDEARGETRRERRVTGEPPGLFG